MSERRVVAVGKRPAGEKATEKVSAELIATKTTSSTKQ